MIVVVAAGAGGAALSVGMCYWYCSSVLLLYISYKRSSIYGFSKYSRYWQYVLDKWASASHLADIVMEI